MSKFLNGLFVGIGIGLFIAPQKGEETRRLIMERVTSLRKSMSTEDEQPISIDTRPPQITSLPAQPAQPLAAVSAQPQRVETTSTNPADTSATASSQSTNSSTNRNVTNTAQNSGMTTNARFVQSADPDLQTSTEESENTAKLPSLSNPSKPNSSNTSGQNANRKASTGAPNTNKSRNNKS